ncbi:cyclohexanone monooxygenase [Streptomyces sp. SAI-117]|uniref:flavin-containing monooxygenase n=1 Tax=unclassified Streptomyces TaxID=2593676 RepID=UPI002474E9F4|nr:MULTISPECIES: NAD(P)/FAD-dependent oxidoreductase [unclassified Streptomyces]MDH6554401.1 cyclohexanone monooxygenase [Streptomyces sp. SAI-041]MDH6573667.1 cyclohexanone monooxygenase [Streptomyces sp. SAI-117]MDH6581600.1 cyclohexanone monooxygenase [Streptomyces sp. SAI-133]
MTVQADKRALGFDPDALREKYRIERDKRLRADGSRQYQALEGELAHFIDDPYTPRIERKPVSDHVDVAVIGGGFGGLLLGARLRDLGYEDIRLVEQGGDFGGTWYWNRYPGAACDTEAYIYLPLLEETGYIPTEKYVKAPEILEHCRRIARHYRLYDNALLQTRVSGVTWNEDAGHWTIETDRGDVFTARYVCMTAGAMQKPKLPGVPGIESFRGHTFHTTRWDYDYTGGDSSGGLEGLADKKVAIVGTGATAIQAVPHLGASAGHLYVVQRTPSAVSPRNNRPTDPAWAASLPHGWQRERMDNFSTFVAGGDAETDLVNDGWTAIYRLRTLSGGVLDEIDDFTKMEEIRARVSATVRDPATAESLKPWFRALCKRPCFNDDYLKTFNRPNVTLLDTDGQGIERVTPTGIVVNGTEYDIDCLVFASGFQVGAPFATRLGYDVVGRGGRKLSEKFSTGISTLYGMQTNGFPNFFIIALNQVGVSSNFAHVLDVQSRHVSQVIHEVDRRGARAVDVAVADEEAWVQTVFESSRANLEFLESCTPGYYNNEGQPNATAARRNGAYGPGIVAFDHLISAWRAEGTWQGLIFEPTRSS